MNSSHGMSPGMFSTNEIKETLKEKDNLIYSLKIKILALEKRLDMSGDNSITELDFNRQVTPLRTASKANNGLERKTFSMLTNRLTELVEFLESGLNGGSFNMGDSTLNITQSLLRPDLDISLMADAGSGDGSHMSFSLASKLQEIIDISRELSLHDAGVETDQEDWKILQEEKSALIAQVEALTAALDNAKASTDIVQEENSSLSSQVSALSEALMEAKNAIDDVEKINSGLNQRVTDAEFESQRLKDDLERATQDLAQQRDLYVTLESQFKKDLCDATVQADENWLVLQEEKNRLFGQINELSQALEAAISSAENAEEENVSLDGHLLEAGMEIDRLKNVLDDVRESVHDEKVALSKELESLKGDLDNAQVAAEHEREQNSLLADRFSKVSADANRLTIQVADLESALSNQDHMCQCLEAALNRDRLDVSLQTEVVWSESDLKAEKSEMGSTISRLVDQIEIMEADLIAVKAVNEQQTVAKGEERDRLIKLIDRFTTETERLELANRDMEAEIAALKESLISTEDKLRQADEKRARWEKAVHKQIGKTHKVIHQASQNIHGFTRGTGAGPLGPLTENRKPL